MWCVMYLLCILLFQSALSYDVTVAVPNSVNTDIPVVSENTTELAKTDTKTSENKAVLMERITQPLQQTQQVERTLDAAVSSSVNTTLKATSKKDGKLENFRPSPQLETYYEYNKFPVKPALPEPKTFGNFGEGRFSLDSWTKRPLVPPWTEGHQTHQPNPNSWPSKPTTTQQTWVSRVKFPSTSHGSTNENPYEFVTNNNKISNHPSANFPPTTEGFAFNKPVVNSNKKAKPTSWFWNTFMGQGTNEKKGPEPIQKTFYDYNLLEKPPQYGYSKEPEYGLSSGPNPWHKVAKLLTAIIPIGLLISAFTPTVVTITSVNDTQSRYRADNTKVQGIADRLSFSLNDFDKLNNRTCRDKVLCELLVSASSSKDSERHIENLLTTFAENEDLKKRKGRSFKSVRRCKKWRL
ncbi:hypothetical protein NQ318_006389 [Aromia moschata]|uniref:Uncharacterized protein n=1 Tax=Aromia moschata TaxID=1265417 RepID=A0AAV8YK16_9CUCU|nr:hypothetical protein NQ318_006389 [Aromia moschata]